MKLRSLPYKLTYSWDFLSSFRKVYAAAFVNFEFEGGYFGGVGDWTIAIHDIIVIHDFRSTRYTFQSWETSRVNLKSFLDRT